MEKMLVYDISEFTQNATKIFDEASTDEVIITNNDGKSYKITQVFNYPQEGKSPLEDIPGIKLNLGMEEIVEIFRECRAGI